MNGLITEFLHPVWGAAPVNLTGVGLASDWVHMKNARRACVFLIGGAWASATPAITLLQATDNAGSGSKALNFDRYWKMTGLTTDIPTEVAVSSTNTFNATNAANQLYWFEWMAEHMDNNNGFTHFQVTVADPAANDFMGCLILLGGLSYPAYPTRQITAID